MYYAISGGFDCLFARSNDVKSFEFEQYLTVVKNIPTLASHLFAVLSHKKNLIRSPLPSNTPAIKLLDTTLKDVRNCADLSPRIRGELEFAN